MKIADTLLRPLLLLAAGSAAAQSQATRHYDEVVPLQLDGQRIAVLGLGAAGRPLDTQAQVLVDALAAHGVQPVAVREIPLGEGVLVTLPDGVSSAALVASLAADGSGLFATPVFFDRVGGPLIPTAEILLRFEAGVDAAAQRELLDALAATTGTRVVAGPGWAGLSGAYKLELATRDGSQVLLLANALADRADVRFATPNWIFTGRSDLVPTDPLFGDSWALHNTGQTGGTPDEDMDAVEAFDITTGDADVIVLVLDVGVEQDHPDIAQVPGEDFVLEGSGGDAFNECDHHGTSVAGCISGLLDNGLGTTGVAPGCRVASARAFSTDTFWCDGSWWTYVESTPEALAWGESIGARVSNNSNFYGFTDPSIEDAYADTKAAGMVHFASAGNFAVSFVEYPASLPDVNAVSATDADGALAWFSSWGTDVVLSAPGVDVMGTDRTGADGYYAEDYGLLSGTSFSSPFCAGVAALVLSHNPYLSAAEVETILHGSAVDHGAAGLDDVYGFGVVNAHGALLATPEEPWEDLGGGTSGVAGPPLLTLSGPLTPGSILALDQVDGAPLSLAILFLSFAATPAPFLGGTLHAFPVDDLVVLGTDGAGELHGAVIFPGAATGQGLWFQVGIADPSVPIFGASLSNGVKGTVP